MKLERQITDTCSEGVSTEVGKTHGAADIGLGPTDALCLLPFLREIDEGPQSRGYRGRARGETIQELPPSNSNFLESFLAEEIVPCPASGQSSSSFYRSHFDRTARGRAPTKKYPENGTRWNVYSSSRNFSDRLELNAMRLVRIESERENLREFFRNFQKMQDTGMKSKVTDLPANLFAR